MELYKYKNLLEQVDSISRNYKKINELTGENFNVFRILKVESSEVRMHSAFLAELLNPKGSHGQGAAFLRLFIKSFCFKETEIGADSCDVKVEAHIGGITDDGKKGGRIDILISDSRNNHIIIENKIYAGDQDYQLLRYYNHSNNANIIYLTLDGKLPDEKSKQNLEEGKHFKCYSYKDDILNWLELCRKEATIYPIVREAITHYINLIKYLTNQTLNKNMENELTDLLKSNLEAAFLISDNLDNACDKICKEFMSSLRNYFEKRGFIFGSCFDFDKKYNGIYIYKNTWKYYKVSFQFQNYDKNLIYGFAQGDPNNNQVPSFIKDKIRDLPNNSNKGNGWWGWFSLMESPHDNWSKFEVWQSVLDGTMKDLFIEKFNYLLKISEGLDL